MELSSTVPPGGAILGFAGLEFKMTFSNCLGREGGIGRFESSIPPPEVVEPDLE